MHDLVCNTLATLERDYDCRVLFAVESGSRAWGFASPDRDYDVRFVYVHPLAWYLDLQKHRDTVEWFYPNDLDCAGWELRKALRLFAGCNLSLFEWLGSPNVYQSTGPLLEALQAKSSARTVSATRFDNHRARRRRQECPRSFAPTAKHIRSPNLLSKRPSCTLIPGQKQPFCSRT